MKKPDKITEAVAFLLVSIVLFCVLSPVVANVVNIQNIESKICTEIIDGNFGKAEQLLSNIQDDTTHLKTLRGIINEYNSIMLLRSKFKRSRHLENVELLKRHLSLPRSDKADDIIESLEYITKALENADIRERTEISQNSYFMDIIEASLKKSRTFQKQGKWIEAYECSYYWLALICPEKVEYKRQGILLLERSSIKEAIHSGTFTENNIQNESIDSDCLRHAIEKLDFGYINIVDYNMMLDEVFEKCQLIGEVVTFPYDNAVCYIEKNKIPDWYEQIENIHRECSTSQLITTPDKFMKVIDQILDVNRRTIQLPGQVVKIIIFNAALKTLDPYTKIIWPAELHRFNKNIQRQYSGIGVTLSKQGSALNIINLIPDGPAYESGLAVNDKVLSIDGMPVESMELHTAADLISGPEGTNVLLGVKSHKDSIVRDLIISRDKINQNTVFGWARNDDEKWKYIIQPENGIAYVKISDFTGRTALDLAKVLANLKSKSIQGLIIDLRFNSGGYLQTAIEIADLFLGKTDILKSRPRFGQCKYFTANTDSNDTMIPLVILLNEYSASASEILAGTLQDPLNSRAIVVGQRSYGKGSMQTIVPLCDGKSKLKYTSARYYFPSGGFVKSPPCTITEQTRNDWGISPNVEIVLSPDEVKEMLMVQQANKIIMGKNPEDYSQASKRYSSQKLLMSDPQLSVGLLVLRASILKAETLPSNKNADVYAKAINP